MGQVIMINEFLEKRFEAFHEKIKGLCSKASFMVDYKHIDKKSDSEPFRLNLGDEQFASIIQDGEINYEQSKSIGTRLEIALEGKFLNFEMMLSNLDNIEIRDEVFVRVIIREGKRKKHIIITAYDLHAHNINPKVKEVSYEIW